MQTDKAFDEETAEMTWKKIRQRVEMNISQKSLLLLLSHPGILAPVKHHLFHMKKYQ